MVRRCGACHITARHRMDMHCDIRGAHGENFEAQCVPGVRKKPRFTHGRDNLRGDVSGKRFSTHVGEGNVAGVAQERLSDGTGGTDTGHCHMGPFREHCSRVPSQSTVTGYCHESLPRINAAVQHHSGI